jgi:MaoC like domain
LGRRVIQTDNSWFTLLTQNTSPVHFDVHYAAQTEFGKPLVDSTFTLALVTGQSVVDVSQHVFADLGASHTVQWADAMSLLGELRVTVAIETGHSRDPCGICCHHTVLGCHIPCEARRIGCSH